jgi:MGT family glycosyltransferase
VLNVPEHGHMNATFPLVAELVRRGERVVYYATEPFRERVEHSGAEYRSYGDPEAFRPPAHTGELYSVMAFAIGLAERVLPDLLPQLRALAPDYLLIDSLCVWGDLARQVLGTPAAMLGSVLVPDERTMTVEAMVRQAYGHAPKETLLSGIDALNTYLMTSQRIDRQFGTESPNMVEFFSNRQALNVIFTSRYFHLGGDAYDDTYQFVGPSIEAVDTRRQPRYSPEPVTTRLSPRVPDARPLLYISMGTIFNDLPHFYRACFEAFGGAQYRVLMTTGKVDAASLGPAPENFELREFVPQLQVLSQASLFLTHGGMNSVSEALWHEVPLLVFPQHGDQHLVAARVAELGAGLVLRPPDIQPDTLRKMADCVLSEPVFRSGARRIAESFRAAGGPRRAADEILAWSRK